MASIFLSTGEASGEQYGVQLLQALHACDPSLQFFGLGGKRLAAAGLDRVVRAEDVAVMGITEIVRHVPRIYREYRRLKQAIAQRRPDVAVFIDFPDVNLSLATHCRRLGIPTVFFVGPQVWAWKQYRLARIRRDIDRMLVIFPFEEPWYRERGVDATFVGHPLALEPAPAMTRKEFAETHGLYEGRRFVALLPGSRPGEIELNLPTMLQAAVALERERPTEHDFVLPLAATLTPAQVARVRAIADQYGAGLPLVFTRDARAALRHARASIVASGTATVQAALMGNPFVVVYRLSGLSHAIAKRVVKVPHVAMVNLIAGERIVPELIQEDFSPARVLAELKPLLDDGPRREQRQEGLARVCAALKGSHAPIESVADVIFSLLRSRTHPAPSETVAS